MDNILAYFSKHASSLSVVATYFDLLVKTCLHAVSRTLVF
jgi:hypothetical protein